MPLTKADIAAKLCTEVRKVEIPEGEDEVLIRIATGAERDELNRLFGAEARGETVKQFRAKVAAIALSDESGNRLFKDSEIMALAGKDGRALDRILNAFIAFNGLNGQTEEIEKN